MQKRILIIGLFIGFSLTAAAQRPDFSVPKTKADSAQLKRDSLNSKPFTPKAPKERVYNPDSNHLPRKAVMHSLMIPGWGQTYNHQIWKVPIIYAGLGLIAWAYLFNQQNYTENLAIVRLRQLGEVPKPGDKYYETFMLYERFQYSDQTISDAVRGYRRYRDLSVLGFAAAWGINVLDAYIDAKFMHSYSMDNNFSVKVRPVFINQPVYAFNFNDSYIPGLKITFTLK